MDAWLPMLLVLVLTTTPPFSESADACRCACQISGLDATPQPTNDPQACWLPLLLLFCLLLPAEWPAPKWGVRTESRRIRQQASSASLLLLASADKRGRYFLCSGAIGSNEPQGNWPAEIPSRFDRIDFPPSIIALPDWLGLAWALDPIELDRSRAHKTYRKVPINLRHIVLRSNFKTNNYANLAT